MELELDKLRRAEPGPRDENVLVLQGQHRSRLIWDADRERPEEYSKLRVRRVETQLRRLPPPSPAVLELVQQAGLEGLLRVPFMQLDLALITALIERWRPETHTFHFKSGESTVTLQDAEVILGLPVQGRAVTGNSDLGNVELLCQNLLGATPEDFDKKGQKVKISWLRDRFTGQVDDRAPIEVVKQQARGLLLLLLGGTIFADHTGRFVNLCWLKLLEDFKVAGQYSWGSAALASLYSGLCHGSTKGKEVAGAFILLQVWAWERFPMLAPRRLGKRAPPPGSTLIGRWHDAFHSPDLATHVVGVYRHALDIQRSNEFKWQPYSAELLESLPPYCRAGMDVWRASVPLICFAIVEMHQPERVMRQFGFKQEIPPNSRAIHPSHGKTLRNGQKDWAVVHATFIAEWDNRMQHVFEAGAPDLTVYPLDDQYVTWYNEITRRYVSRPGAAIDGAIRCFEFLTRPGVPQAPQLYAEVGRAGLQHLAELEKFLRREPPVHGVFVGEGAEGHVQEGGAQQVEEAIVQQVEEAIVQPEGVPHAQHEAYREEPIVQPEALGANQPAPIHDQTSRSKKKKHGLQLRVQSSRQKRKVS